MNHKNTPNRKHLTMSQRLIIENGLQNRESFDRIAKRISKDPSTISKEVQRHRIHHTKQDGGRDIPCSKRRD